MPTGIVFYKDKVRNSMYNSILLIKINFNGILQKTILYLFFMVWTYLNTITVVMAADRFLTIDPS